MNKELIYKILNETPDIYGDFYFTKDNIRYYIHENLNMFFDGIKKGDKIFTNETTIVSIIGYSDNATRKYIKILTSDINLNIDFLKTILDNTTDIIYAKYKKNNPITAVLLKNRFEVVALRGKEILLIKANKG